MTVDEIPRGRNGGSALETAVRASRMAGAAVLDHFPRRTTALYKGTGSLGNVVTQTDLAAEKAALAAILDDFPDHNILSEEAGENNLDSAYTWVVDPLDGTLNYSYGLGFFAVSVALLERGEPVVGVVFDPVRNELFTAEKGGGTFVNGAPATVSAKDSLAVSLACFDLGYDEAERTATLKAAADLQSLVQGLRTMGSAALSLAYVACARFDLYFHRYLFPWDVAAAILLVQEAGGVITSWDGRPATVATRQVVAAAPPLHATFVRLQGSD